MKCSIISRPSWSKSQSVLTVGTANLFCNLEGLGDAQVVIPVQLKYIKQRNGSLSKPLVDVRQPQYQDQNGKYRTSYLTIHLAGGAVKQVSELISAEWLKRELKRLMGTSIAGDYERKDGKWIHLGDRSLTQVGNSEDEDFLAKASNAALEFAKNSTSQSSTPSATVMDDKVAEEVLGM